MTLFLNPLSYRDGYTFTWQHGRRLASVSHGDDSISYTYDPDGIRTSKTVNGTTTKYHVMNGTLLGQTKGSDTIVFLYDEKANRYGFDYNGTKYYYIFNVQGDVIGILNQSGSQIVSYQYDPWGKVLSVDGTQASTIGQLNPIRYRGYYYDTETGFYYLQSRYYDPITRRFLNPDTLILEGTKIDLISYCKNNPVNYVDPNGNVVFYYGWNLGISVFGHGDVSYVIAVDSHGGVTPLFMYGYGGGCFGASSGQVIGIIWGADTIEDIEGAGGFYGGSGSTPLPIPLLSAGIAADLVHLSHDIVNSDIAGLQISGSISVGIPYEVQGGHTETINLAKEIYVNKQIEHYGSFVGPRPGDFSTNRNYSMYKGYDSIYYKEHYGWTYPWEHVLF